MNRRAVARTRLSAPVMLTGLLGSIALALSFNGTLGALTAQITNTTNRAGINSFVLNEYLFHNNVGGTEVKCSSALNSGVCGTIDKFGSQLNLNTSQVGAPVEVLFKKQGDASVTDFFMDFGACTTGASTDLCHTSDATKAMAVRIEYSDFGKTAWKNVINNVASDTTSKLAATWRTGTSAKSTSFFDAGALTTIKSYLNDVSNTGGVYFRFTIIMPSAGADGSSISQPISWGVTTS